MGINDEDVQLLRDVLNKYVRGDELNALKHYELSIDALDSMDYYGNVYLNNKFLILYVWNGLGGRWFKIVFINKPDKAFNVWIKNQSVLMFADAQFSKRKIRTLLQKNVQLLNNTYGF